MDEKSNEINEEIDENNFTDDKRTSEIDKPLNEILMENEKYFRNLQAWVQEANNVQNAHNKFINWMIYLGMMVNTQQQTIQHQISRSTFRSEGFLRMTYEIIRANQPPPPAFLPNIFCKIKNYFQNNRRYERIIAHSGGFPFTIAPLWKRFAAQVIDIILMLLMIMAVYAVFRTCFKIEYITFGFDLRSLHQLIYEDDEETGFIIMGLIFLDIILKPAVSFYEAFWTMDGGGAAGGATPGKLIIGIRIICTDTIVQRVRNPNHNSLTDPIRVLVLPVRSLGFRRAYIRAFCKNVLMFIMFPMSLLSFGFNNNRNAYDYLVKTIVVENNYNGRIRRRLQRL